MNTATIETRRGYNLVQFQHFKTKWENPRPLVLSKGGIPLTTDDNFSPALQEVLGLGNTTYIHGLEGPHLVGMFEALMDREACALYHYGTERDAIKRFTQVEDFYYCKLDRTGTLRWRMWGKQEVSGHWVDLISYVFNLPAMDALATLAEMLRTNIENLQHPTNGNSRDGSAAFRHLTVDVPELLSLTQFSSGHKSVELVYRHDIHDHSGEVCGSFLEYTVDGKKFCLPATVRNDVLSVGNHPPRACFLNEDILGRYPASTILFFQDARSALSMEKRLGQIQGYDPTHFIVTAHLGDDLKIFPWSYFWGHDVIFIPAASKGDMARVKLYKDFITGGGANSFRAFPGFLLHSAPGAALEQAKENLTSHEAALLRDTMFIDDIEMPLRAVRQIIEKAISFEGFIKWGQDLEIFRKPKESVTLFSTHECPGLPPADPSEIPPAPLKLEEVVLHHFIRPGSNVLILGAKNAGKTLFALSVCQALCQKSVLCSLFHNRSKVPGKVAYIDAETPLDEFQANLKRYQLKNDDGFLALSKFGERPQGLPNSFSLINPEFREGLRNHLLKKHCRYIVLDNLTALMGNNVDYGSPAQEVIDWIEQLQIDNICAVLIHHKTDTDTESTHYKGRGSRIFNIRARNVIELIGRDEILNNRASETIKAAVLQDGMTIGIRFKTCKAAGVLDGKTFYAHLPFGAAHWQFLEAYGLDGKEIEISGADEGSALTETQQPDTEESSLNDMLKTLSPDHHRVVEILKDGSATREDIQKQLKLGESKTQRILGELVEMKIATRHGASSSTYYALNTVK
ncbi:MULTISPECIES: AAA family ATPase [unclassified Desulfovibrio]|uniref:AAA family ATPase n=1 Tax=unclassified Desulfovibrio TaxID=2593640 RepID=UPI0013ED3E6D|nr:MULTISPECIES: AAA family ATPase [unclassified Desulfovibrio]